MHSFMVTAVIWCVEDDDDDLQAIIMWPPSFIDMIKSMRHPLLLKHFVSFLAYVERLTTPVGKKKGKEKKKKKKPKLLLCQLNGKLLHYIINTQYSYNFFPRESMPFLLVRGFCF